eukprot:m.27507 g.27507  ORF g.27507 m.27507 type:complete len:147 (+) comp9021_c0_seq1:1389-1829(+)
MAALARTFVALRAVRTPVRMPVRTWFGFGMKQAPMFSDETPRFLSRQPVEWLEGIEKDRSAEELQEREAFRKEEVAMLNETPQRLPGKEFFQRFMTTLMKWDDREGIIGTLNFAEEYEIEFDPEFKKKVDDYVYDAQMRACHKPGW